MRGPVSSGGRVGDALLVEERESKLGEPACAEDELERGTERTAGFSAALVAQGRWWRAHDVDRGRSLIVHLELHGVRGESPLGACSVSPSVCTFAVAPTLPQSTTLLSALVMSGAVVQSSSSSDRTLDTSPGLGAREEEKLDVRTSPKELYDDPEGKKDELASPTDVLYGIHGLQYTWRSYVPFLPSHSAVPPPPPDLDSAPFSLEYSAGWFSLLWFTWVSRPIFSSSSRCPS